MINIKTVEQIVIKHDLGAIHDIRPANEFPTIGSDGIFRVNTSDGKFTVKFINDKQKLRERIQYHQATTPFIPLPKILTDGPGYAVFEFIEGTTLLHKVLHGDSDVPYYYEQALYLLRNLWGATKGRTENRNCLELTRAHDIVMKFLDGNQERLMIINGEDFRFNFRHLFLSILEFMTRLPVNCFSHGDAHMDNVIVCSNGKNELTFIDLRPGFCWIDDLVIYGWQKGFQIVKFLESPQTRTTNGKLKINFRLEPSSFTTMAENLALKTAREFVNNNGADDWLQRYYYTVSAAAICEIAGIQRRRMTDALGCALPDNAEYFWVAEAAQNFSLARSWTKSQSE